MRPSFHRDGISIAFEVLTVPFLATHAVTDAAEASWTRKLKGKTIHAANSDATAAGGRANERSSSCVCTDKIHQGRRSRAGDAALPASHQSAAGRSCFRQVEQVTRPVRPI